MSDQRDFLEIAAEVQHSFEALRTAELARQDAARKLDDATAVRDEAHGRTQRARRALDEFLDAMVP